MAMLTIMCKETQAIFQFEMKKAIILYVVSVIVYIRSAPTDAEEVWLKDVTTSFHTDKRTLSDRDLADELTFKLMHGSHTITLNLKRNYGIDPNADVYIVRNSKDGRYQLHKTLNLDMESLAYYQDAENGAFMTVRCVKGSNGHCNRVINGNIRIGDINYDLQPAETDVTSRNVFDATELLGRRYVLRDQANKDGTIVNEINVDKEHIRLRRRFPEGKCKRNRSPHTETMLSSRNVAGVHKSATKVKKDNVNQVYDVGMTVLIDSGIWDLFSSLVNISDAVEKENKVRKKIRGFYSHVINGVDLRYKGIEDTSISISVTLRQFVIFELETQFRHKDSKAIMVNGVKSIDIKNYLDDILEWDIFVGWELPDYDHAMLFTRYDLYEGDPSNNGVRGLCWTGRVCELGSKTSVVEVGDYFLTVGTATHELGHSLGAVHDGTGNAKACKSEDSFIMTEHPPKFDKSMLYFRNPWIFSNCSVEAFKSTLKDKDCVKTKSVVYNETEWNKFMWKLPGEVYNVDEQCKMFVGHKSYYCRTETQNICLFMKCADQKKGNCMRNYNYYSAARGTICGRNMWCIDGRCVAKPPK